MASKYDESKVTYYNAGSKRKSLGTKLQRKSIKLNKNLSAAHQWLINKWIMDVSKTDNFNKPLSKYIPLISNTLLNYVIDITESQDEVVLFKQRIKDSYYKEKGFQVFRVIAYDEGSYQATLANILQLRSNVTRR